MWQEDKGLIQVELGSSVIDLTTKTYDRNVFDQVMGTKIPEPGQLLLEGIKNLRESLDQQENLPLLTVNVRDDDSLDADVARIYFGIEMTQLRVKRIEDILNVLLSQTRKYFVTRPKAEDLPSILAASSADAGDNDYYGAFQKVCTTYFFSVIEERFVEQNLALGYGGNYSLRNGDFAHAYSYLCNALNGINSSNIFPAEIRASLSLDTGNVLRIWGDTQSDRETSFPLYEAAAENFAKTIEIAKFCNDTVRLYFGLCGLAGIAYIFDDLDSTESLISSARDLLIDKDERECLTNFLLEVLKTKNFRLMAENAQLKGIIRELDRELKQQRLVNQMGKFFIQLIIAPSINAALSGMGLLGQNIRISDSRFTAPVQIGFKNYQSKIVI